MYQSNFNEKQLENSERLEIARSGVNGEGPVCLDRLRRENGGLAFYGENHSVRRFLSFNIVSEEVREFLPKPGIAP